MLLYPNPKRRTNKMEMIVQGINYIIPISIFAAGWTSAKAMDWLLSKLEITEDDIVYRYKEHKDVFKDGGK